MGNDYAIRSGFILRGIESGLYLTHDGPKPEADLLEGGPIIFPTLEEAELGRSERLGEWAILPVNLLVFPEPVA